jgi:hypothetical protein
MVIPLLIARALPATGFRCFSSPPQWWEHCSFTFS